MRSAATLWRSASTCVYRGSCRRGSARAWPRRLPGRRQQSARPWRPSGADHATAVQGTPAVRHSLLKLRTSLRGIDRLTDLGGNNPVAIDPSWCGEPLSCLGGPVGAQLSRKWIRHGDGAATRSRLWFRRPKPSAVTEWTLGGRTTADGVGAAVFPRDTLQLPTDRQRPGVEIDVGPPEPQRLATT